MIYLRGRDYSLSENNIFCNLVLRLESKLFSHVDLDELSLVSVLKTLLISASGIGDENNFIAQIIVSNVQITSLNDRSDMRNGVLWSQSTMEGLELLLEGD